MFQFWYITGVNRISSLEGNPIISLLVVNKIQYLGKIALQSITNSTESRVVVGYLNYSDIEDLRSFENLQFLNLSREAIELGILATNSYQDYTTDNFFKLVQLKWRLFDRVFEEYNFPYLIYSDLDVVWIESPERYLSDVFEVNKSVQICIQDSTVNDTQKTLCMGFVAFRNTSESLSIIRENMEAHTLALVSNLRAGDDGVITEYYKARNNKSFFYLLPQISFPIGLFSNVYSDLSPFTGLIPSQPFIFHANYIVGARRKAIMMLFILRKNRISVKAPIKLKLELIARIFLLPLKKLFMSIKFVL
jgi:hypothetical protein